VASISSVATASFSSVVDTGQIRPVRGTASQDTYLGHELIATGMLILAGGGIGVPLDNGELERWTRIGCAARIAVKARRAVGRVRAARGYCVQIADSGEVALARPSGGSPYAA